VSCVDERRVVENEEEGEEEEESEMESFVFSRRIEYLDRRYLSVLRSASGNLKSRI